MSLPRRFRYLDVFINEYTDIHALFPVIKMFSAKHQHWILNHFPLTCHSKSFIYGKALPSLSFPTNKGERTFIIHCNTFSLPSYILLLQTQNSSLTCWDPKATGRGTSLLWKSHDCQISLTDLKPEQAIGWHSLCINILWLLLCSLLHRYPL